MNDLSIAVNEVARLHELANSTALQAIKYAKELGELLLSIKKELPHGHFTQWLEANVSVSERQAQRYMAAAKGKKVTIQELGFKNDTMSVLKSDEIRETPLWIPELGKRYWTSYENATYWVVPCSWDHGGFFVSKLYTVPGDYVQTELDDEKEWDGHSFYDGTIRPIDPEKVDAFLQISGLPNSHLVKWNESNSKGMEHPFGKPMAPTECSSNAQVNIPTKLNGESNE